MSNRWLKAFLRWFNLRPWWQRRQIRVWGNRLHAPTFDRWLALRLHQAGWMGVADRAFLADRIRPGMTVVDIGANQGLYTLLFSNLAGENGRVLAFEPDALLHRALQANVESNGARNVRVFPVALGARSGTMTLYRSLLNSGDNRLAEHAAENAGPRDAVAVRIERVDEILAREQIDFVKMDVQGWEMEVIRGMTGLFRSVAGQGMAIYFEYWPQGLRDAGSEPVGLLKFLVHHGFVIHSLDASGVPEVVRDFAGYTDSITKNSYTNLYAVLQPGNIP